METILHTEVFDHFDKTYLLDRNKGSGSGPAVRITETVHNGSRRGKYVLEVDASVLERIRAFLEKPIPPAPVSSPAAIKKQRWFNGEQQDAITRNYLKGVTSDALALQYGCKAAEIEAVLRANGIEVVDQTPPKPKWYRSKRNYDRKR